MCNFSDFVSRAAFAPGTPTYAATDFELQIQTSRGNILPAFHIDKGHALTILVSHTNAEDLGMVHERWSALSDTLRVNVFGYEFSGFGHSSGSGPSERNLLCDARAALAGLLRAAPYLRPETDIVLYGKSIGACAACHLASKHRVRAVILCSPIASGVRVLSSKAIAHVADGAALNTIGKLAKLSVPVQLIHGVDDGVASIKDARAMYKVQTRFDIQSTQIQSTRAQYLISSGPFWQPRALASFAASPLTDPH